MTTVKTLKSQLNNITVTSPKFTSKSQFSPCRVLLDGKALKVKLTGNLFMLPAKNEHEDYGISFKMGVEFEEDDMVVFDKVLEEMLKKVGDDEFAMKPCHEDGNIFFKLGTNRAMSEFTFESNVAIRPGKLVNEKLEQHMQVTLELTVSGWYLKKKDEDEKKFGLTFKIRKICFGQEKVKHVSKKRKTGGGGSGEKEEDEVSIISST
jgi:hypothetical protein